MSIVRVRVRVSYYSHLDLLGLLWLLVRVRVAVAQKGKRGKSLLSFLFRSVRIGLFIGLLGLGLLSLKRGKGERGKILAC